MAITYVNTVPAGNALRVYVNPGAAACWTILRRTDANFTSVNDPDAVVVAANTDSPVILDFIGLVNGTEYFYCDFGMVNGAVVMGTPVSGTPVAAYSSGSVDPLVFVRDRLRLGLANEVKWGTLKPESGVIQVVTAPYALIEGIKLPCVSVHLESDAPGTRGVGEMQFPAGIGAGGWEENEGWLASFKLNVVGVSLNADERIALRQAIKRVIQANLTVFTAVGFVNISFSQHDAESFTENAAPLFMSNGFFECDAPSLVIFTEPEVIETINVSIIETVAEFAS